MLKQIVMVLSIAVFFSVFTLAQEEPDQSSTDVKEEMKMENEEHHSCCGKNIEQEESETCTGKHDSYNSMTETNDEQEVAEALAWNKVCPVKGNEVDPEVGIVEFNGKLYGFCCTGCGSKFKKDSDKYSKNLSEDGAEYIGS